MFMVVASSVMLSQCSGSDDDWAPPDMAPAFTHTAYHQNLYQKGLVNRTQAITHGRVLHKMAYPLEV